MSSLIATLPLDDWADRPIYLTKQARQAMEHIRLYGRRPPYLEPVTDLSDLSDTQMMVAFLVGMGMRDTLIADTLDMTKVTLSTHVARIRAKTGITNRSEYWKLLFEVPNE